MYKMTSMMLIFIECLFMLSMPVFLFEYIDRKKILSSFSYQLTHRKSSKITNIYCHNIEPNVRNVELINFH